MGFHIIRNLGVGLHFAHWIACTCERARKKTCWCETYAPHALSSVGTNPCRSMACRHHDFSKFLEGRCADRMEQFGVFWWLGAENGPSSDASERFYMSCGPCSGGVPSAAPSPVLIVLASRKSRVCRACTFGTSGMFFGHEIKISVE